MKAYDGKRKGGTMGATVTKLLRIADVAEMLDMSEATVYRYKRGEDFPRPIRLGGPNTRALRWRRSDVEDWLESRPAATAKGAK